jgi:hypothetical protein
MVTFTINIPQMLPYMAYMDPMGISIPYLDIISPLFGNLPGYVYARVELSVQLPEGYPATAAPIIELKPAGGKGRVSWGKPSEKPE